MKVYFECNQKLLLNKLFQKGNNSKKHPLSFINVFLHTHADIYICAGVNLHVHTCVCVPVCRCVLCVELLVGLTLSAKKERKRKGKRV